MIVRRNLADCLRVPDGPGVVDLDLPSAVLGGVRLHLECRFCRNEVSDDSSGIGRTH